MKAWSYSSWGSIRIFRELPLFLSAPNGSSTQVCTKFLMSDCAVHSEPEWESFAKDRQRWEKPIEGTVQYKGKSKGEKMPESI